MTDLEELKGRVERATRVLSEREAEEQGRHTKLTSLIAALESKSLEARRDKQRAEERVVALTAENDELRGLLTRLLDAVEAGSRSRFAEAIYALEARVAGASDAERATGAASAPDAEPGQAETAEPRDRNGDVTVGSASDSASEKQPETVQRKMTDEAKAVLERIRQQVEAPASSGELRVDAGEAASSLDEGTLAGAFAVPEPTLSTVLESADWVAETGSDESKAEESGSGELESDGAESDGAGWDGQRRVAIS